MNLTLTVCNIADAHQAQAMLRAYVQQILAHRDTPQQTPLDVLELGGRACNTLKAEGIETIEQLTHLCARDLLRMPNLGRGTANEITRALAARGLTLGM